MTNPIARRDFLAGSLAAGTAATLASDTVEAKPRRKAAQEFYELRIYRCDSKDNQKLTLDHLEHALLPALRRSGASRTGTFTVISDKPDHSSHVLILYPTLDVLGTRNEKLAGDKKFHKAAKEFFAIPKNKPAYSRIETRLMKAFSGMPVVEFPASTKKKTERMFELRIYEAHNDLRHHNDGSAIDVKESIIVFFSEHSLGNSRGFRARRVAVPQPVVPVLPAQIEAGLAALPAPPVFVVARRGEVLGAAGPPAQG